MYTATMLYHFKEDSFDKACEIWKNEVMEHARSQPGFIRMQFLVARPNALALGTWEDNAHARRFMETGVFKRLLRPSLRHGGGQSRADDLGPEVLHREIARHDSSLQSALNAPAAADRLAALRDVAAREKEGTAARPPPVR